MRTLTSLVVTGLLLAATAAAVTPGPPRLINYQGRLTDASGTPLPDGAKSIRFIIWNDPTLSAHVNEVWNSGPLTVTTTSGLFSVQLGASPQPALTPGLLADTLRWLGITVGADPEIGPRTRLVSVPYSFNSENAQYAVTSSTAAYADSARTVSDNYVKTIGDTMSGGLYLHDGVQMDAVLQPYSTGSKLTLYNSGVAKSLLSAEGGAGYLSLKDSDHDETVFLSANLSSGGQLIMRQEDATLGMSLYGGSTSNGSRMYMYSAGGLGTIQLDADGVGNASVFLPDNAISAEEMWNEPGIAANNAAAGLSLTTTMTDQTTVSITTPAAGYILLFGKAFMSSGGTRGANYSYAQIDETSGGSLVAPYYVGIGTDSTPSTGSYFQTVAVQRVYYKASADTYTFRLEAMEYSSNGAGANTVCYYPMLTALYLPTSYGTVNEFMSDAGAFHSAEPVRLSATGPEQPSSATLYHVDLRELELRAAKAQAEAERAQREVAEAKLQAERESRERR
jgi:hypothetical protein